MQRPLKKHPWEVQLAVFESRPGCAESQKIGQVILNMASYAGKEQKLVLPINGGFSSGELSITLSVQAAQAGIAGPNPPSTAPEALNMFGWTRTKSKQLLSSLKRTYATGLGKEEEGPSGSGARGGRGGAGLPIDGRREERGEPGGRPRRRSWPARTTRPQEKAQQVALCENAAGQQQHLLGCRGDRGGVRGRRGGGG